MITRSEWKEAREIAWNMVQDAGVLVHNEDISRLDVVDLGLGELTTTGLQVLTLLSTELVGVKLLILQPNQFFPQHRHPPPAGENYPGKEETFRGQWGEAYLYVHGEIAERPSVTPPLHRQPYLSVWHEIMLLPGDQYTCQPNTWHWFQAGPQGAVVWSYSSRVTDTVDQFSDPEVVRETQIVDDSEETL